MQWPEEIGYETTGRNLKKRVYCWVNEASLKTPHPVWFSTFWHLEEGTGKSEKIGYRGLPGGVHGREPACQCWSCRFDPGSGRFPGRGHGNPLQDNCLENPMDRGAWQATAHGVTKSRTRLSNLALGDGRKDRQSVSSLRAVKLFRVT